MHFPLKTSPVDELPLGLNTIVEREINTAQSTDKPVIIHMLGVPGCGKSTLAKALFQQLGQSNFFYLGFDKVMESIPAYQNISDKEEAFNQFELPARDAGYTLLEALIEKRVNLLFDHGGSFSKHPDILHHAQSEHGYKTIMVEACVSSDIAKKRLTERSNTPGNRFTPLHYVDERQKDIDHLRSPYKSVASHFIQIANETTQDLENFKKNGLNTIIEKIGS